MLKSQVLHPQGLVIDLPAKKSKAPDFRRGWYFLPFRHCTVTVSMSKKVCAGDGTDGGQDVEVEERAWFAGVMKTAS